MKQQRKSKFLFLSWLWLTLPAQGQALQPHVFSIYGVWQGQGQANDGSRYTQRLVLEPGHAFLVKICEFADGQKLQVEAESAAATNHQVVVLAGGFFANLQIQGRSCQIQLPSGLEFFLREQALFVRLLGAEKRTALERVEEFN